MISSSRYSLIYSSSPSLLSPAAASIIASQSLSINFLSLVLILPRIFTKLISFLIWWIAAILLILLVAITAPSLSSLNLKPFLEIRQSLSSSKISKGNSAIPSWITLGTSLSEWTAISASSSKRAFSTSFIKTPLVLRLYKAVFWSLSPWVLIITFSKLTSSRYSLRYSIAISVCFKARAEPLVATLIFISLFSKTAL